MKITIQKWGNSLALRIPKVIAKEAHLAKGEMAELRWSKGKLTVTPLPHKPWTLKTLLAQVKKKNLHPETGAGDSRGLEIW